MDHLARRSRKTEANREKERESQDEPIVDKSNAHGARGEILRGLVRSRVGHHYVPELREESTVTSRNVRIGSRSPHAGAWPRNRERGNIAVSVVTFCVVRDSYGVASYIGTRSLAVSGHSPETADATRDGRTSPEVRAVATRATVPSRSSVRCADRKVSVSNRHVQAVAVRINRRHR